MSPPVFIRIGTFNIYKCLAKFGSIEFENRFLQFCNKLFDIIVLYRVSNETLINVLKTLLDSKYSINCSKTSGNRVFYEILCVKQSSKGISFTINRKSNLYSNTHNDNCLTWAEIQIKHNKNVVFGITEFEDPIKYPKMNQSQLNCALNFMNKYTNAILICFPAGKHEIVNNNGWKNITITEISVWERGFVKNVGMRDIDELGYAVEGTLSLE